MGNRPDIGSGSKPRGGRGRLLAPPALSLVARALGAVGASAGGLANNPANDPRLLKEPIDDLRYDRADHCERRTPRGMKALQNWLERNVRGESWGIYRCERLKRDNFSLHAESRAIDWRLDAGVKQERRAAMRLIRILTEADRAHNVNALARRMGVQGLIFDCKSWWAGMEELGEYSYCYRRNGELRDNLDRTAAHRDLAQPGGEELRRS